MNNKKLKKIGFLLTAVLFSVIGCAQRKEAKTAPREPKVIEFWHAFKDAPRSGWIQEKADEWNAMNPGYVVKPERKGSYRETLQAAILAARQGDAPNIVQVFEVGSKLAYDSGIFIPVSEAGDFDTSDYIAPVLNYYTINGKVNSIPFNSSSPILYYNKDLMKKAGLDPENPPKTFQEIIEAGEKARKAGLKEKIIGFNLHSWFFEQWMAEQGAPLVNNNGREAAATELALTSPAALNILNWYKEINDKGFYAYTGKPEDWSGSDAIFTEGKVLFHITSTADVGNIAKAVKGKFELGTGLLPTPGKRRDGVVIGGGSLWLTKGHPKDELEAALNFVLYMTNTDNMIQWHKLTGYYPVRISSVDKLKKQGWFDEEKLRLSAFNQLLETKTNTATAGALLGTFLDTRTLISEAMQKVLNGVDPKKALETANTLANQKLAEYNSN